MHLVCCIISTLLHVYYVYGYDQAHANTVHIILSLSLSLTHARTHTLTQINSKQMPSRNLLCFNLFLLVCAHNTEEL